MQYISTRNKNSIMLSSEAIIKGISEDGGLYVPMEIPKLDENLENLAKLDYKELAFFIMSKYFTDFDDSELKDCIEKAYNDKFTCSKIAPLVEKEDVHFLELFHGPTLAFKDMALSILPHLLKVAIKKQKLNKEVVILTATSGDTGKAALEGFANVEGTKIIVFYPENGVSEIQKRQMITQEGENTFVASIYGNFDDAQNGVKEIFNDKEFAKLLSEHNYILSSANSINIGRLIPQVVYYFYAYLTLLKAEKIKNNEAINAVVPTGNFGNILAGFYAKEMGLPINKLICASNENNVLYDFFKSGIYDRKRELKLTSSPSMDILISSNLERLLYEVSERDEKLIKELIDSLNKEGSFKITNSMITSLEEFYGGYAKEEEVFKAIKNLYENTGYVIDTHTAVAYCVYKKYKAESNDNTQSIIASTASPFKFGKSICDAIKLPVEGYDDFHILEKLSEVSKVPIPKSIEGLKDKNIIHNNLYKKDELKLAISKFLKV